MWQWMGREYGRGCMCKGVSRLCGRHSMCQDTLLKNVVSLGSIKESSTCVYSIFILCVV